jgi:hypothetical protein
MQEHCGCIDVFRITGVANIHLQTGVIKAFLYLIIYFKIINFLIG